MLSRFFGYIRGHKKMTFFLIAVICLGGYFINKKMAAATVQTQYVLASVERGTLAVSLSGSGQVLTSNQIDIKTETAGKVLSINVKNGDEVKAGTVLAQLDVKDAQKTVRDASLNLQSAEISLQKLKRATDVLTIAQAENALQNEKNDLEKLKLSQESAYEEALDTKQNAIDGIATGNENAFNTISDAFLDLPTLITSLSDVLYSDTIFRSEPSVGGGSRYNIDALLEAIDFRQTAHRTSVENFQKKAEASYTLARAKYDLNLQHYNETSRYSSTSTIEALLAETVDTVKSFAELAKNESNYLGVWKDTRDLEDLQSFRQVDTYQSDLANYIGQINTHINNLISIDKTIKNNKDSLKTAERNLIEMKQNHPFEISAQEKLIQEKEAVLADLKQGPDVFDLRSQELAVQQRRNALVDAQEKLLDASIKAPFDGVVAAMTIKKGDSLSSGASVFTFIAKQYLAEISLNEVDVSKLKIGQKTILNFDAIEGLSLTGVVAEIDTLGTVSQGVVNYNVKIAFDTQDERIKPGMSVSTSIITDVKQNVLMVPSAAVKSSGGTYYVESPAEIDLSTAGANATQVVGTAPVIQHTVEIGLINDSNTEISGDIKVGDKIIIRTINATQGAATPPAQNSLFPMPGGNNRGAGAR